MWARSMSELYLVAHKVRGEPAFDVAVQMDCPLCAGHGHDLDGVCHECDSTGYWWVISTSGHRAFPYAFQPWHAMDIGPGFDVEMPSNLPDHYPARAAPSAPKLNLEGLLPKASPIRRRV